MFLKLCKHEFKCTYRMFFILYAILLLAAYSLASILAAQYGSPYGIQWLVMYVVAIFATLIGCEILIFRSYYLSMCSNAGYLTNTLPVSERTLFLAKLFVYSVWTILSGICVLGSIFLVFTAVPEVTLKPFPMMFWIIMAISLLLQAIFNTVLIMTAITAAHTSFIRNHRLFIALIIYFAVDFIREGIASRLPSSAYIANHPEFVALHDINSLNQLATPLGIGLLLASIVVLTSLGIYFMKHKMELE